MVQVGADDLLLRGHLRSSTFTPTDVGIDPQLRSLAEAYAAALPESVSLAGPWVTVAGITAATAIDAERLLGGVVERTALEQAAASLV